MTTAQQETIATNYWLNCYQDEQQQLKKDFCKWISLIQQNAKPIEVNNAWQELLYTMESAREIQERYLPELTTHDLDAEITEGVTLETVLIDAFDQTLEVNALALKIGNVQAINGFASVLLQAQQECHADLLAITSLLPLNLCELFYINGLPCMAHRSNGGTVTFELLTPRPTV